jgi:hypothetical protein
MKWLNHSLAFVLCCTFLSAVGGYSQPAVAQQPPAELEQLVAPIALYPDPLVAQILAASTYPSEVVEAWRWMQGHSGLEGQSLVDAVDRQPWDPSVKTLIEFPSVLDSMNSNLAWTSALGDAYVNQPQDVLDAIQALRQRAQSAGSLQSTSEESVTAQGPTIAIEPADPDVVYVPEYDPWLAYGESLASYPGWVGVPGVYYAGPDPYFGVGGVGLAAGFGWAWRDWGFDWRNRRVTYNHAPYISHSRTFANRHDFDRGSERFDHLPMHSDQGPAQFGPRAAPFAPAATFHGGGPERDQVFDGRIDGRAGLAGLTRVHSGAFSGFDHGGVTRGYASRGQSSFKGGLNAGGLGAGRAHAGGFNAGGMHAGGSLGGGFHGGGDGGFHGGGGGGGHR